MTPLRRVDHAAAMVAGVRAAYAKEPEEVKERDRKRAAEDARMTEKVMAKLDADKASSKD